MTPDPLAAPRGCCVGCVLSAVLWVLLGGVVLAVWALAGPVAVPEVLP